MSRRILANWMLLGIGLTAAAVVQAAGDVTDERVRREARGGGNWLVKGGNFQGHHFSPLKQIKEKNVGELGLAWSLDLPVTDGVSATPIVVDGVIFLSAAYSKVFAIDASDGTILWTYDPKVRTAFAKTPYLSWPARANRGVAVWHGKVIATTADCRLIALDAETGAEQWARQICDPELGYSITDSPYVGGWSVFVGNAGSESYRKNRGFVSAYDIRSGNLLWRFFTVPSDNPAKNTSPAMRMAEKTWSREALAEFGGGGNNWNEMTYDPDSGLLFFGTAGALPYQYSARSPSGGDNLFLSSVVAVRADTGKYVWHYQTVPEDSWDYNATTNIVLADMKINGDKRKTLMIAPKNGFHYVLDRLTGELLSAENYARVNWASRINLETGRPVYSRAAEYWNREDADVAVWPNMWGAHSWQPMAWHPDHRLVYIPVIDLPSIVTSYPDGEFDEALTIVTEIDGRPFSSGKLLAWDPVAQSARWTVPHDLPFNGGVLATAGNLVFQGNADGQFVAYAADTGVTLWARATGSAITAAPVTYKVGRRQHILIPIGSAGGLQYSYPEMHATDAAAGPTRLLAFTLEGKAILPLAATTARPLPEPPSADADAETIEQGRILYALECKICHGHQAIARAGGSVPDLRYSSAETHANWNRIVIDGSMQADGMPPFAFSAEESAAIQNYVLTIAAPLRTENRGRRGGASR